MVTQLSCQQCCIGPRRASHGLECQAYLRLEPRSRRWASCVTRAIVAPELAIDRLDLARERRGIGSKRRSLEAVSQGRSQERKGRYVLCRGDGLRDRKSTRLKSS